MPRSYQKSILRTFRSTKSRFFAIFSIVALGVGFLAGLMATTPDMKESMERHMDAAHLYDIRIVSTLGLTEEDVAVLQGTDGIAAVQPAYSTDLLMRAGEDTLVTRVQSLPPQSDDALNRLTLVEGRWPEAPDECVVDAGVTRLGGAVQVGQVFTASPDNGDMSTSLPGQRFTAVGLVRSPAYFSIEREAASVGDGSVALLFYVPDEAFAYEAYTELYLALDGAEPLASLEPEYEALSDAAVEMLEALAPARCQARLDGIRADARAELDDGWAEYNDAKAEADEGFAEAEAKLADARAELDDGEKQYGDGARTLEENEQKLRDGRAELENGRAELERRQGEYDAGAAQLAAGSAELESARAQLEAGRAPLAAGRAELEAGRAELESARAQLEAGRAELEEGRGEYERGLEQVSDALAERGLTVTVDQLDAALTELAALPDEELADPARLAEHFLKALGGARLTPEQAQSLRDAASRALEALEAQTLPPETPPEAAAATEALKAELARVAGLDDDALQAELQPLLDALNGADADALPPELRETLRELERAFIEDPPPGAEQLVEGLPGLIEARRLLTSGEAELAANEAQLAEAEAALAAGEEELAANEAQFAEAEAALAAAEAELADGEAELADGGAQLAAGWQTLAGSEQQLSDGERELQNGRRELADAWQEILDGRAELADGEQQYADERADAEAELADARRELEDAEAELDDLELPEWYIWDRTANTSFNSFKGNVSKVEAIARVFPIFFFLVAALVVSTTMTRMVEEERLQIGTMKALGYARGAIMKKYILYALTAAVFGALAGLAMGFTVFPSVIWYAYEMMYYAPGFSTPWRANYALMAGGLLIGCALVATLSACRATLRETPADLMRPRAPKAGKRIFLERVGFLWRRLPFTYKVTFRNLLRYKKRFWMTVIGVAGCTALLVTGFGISDSLNGIAIKQFGQIYRYDLLTAVTDEADTQTGPVHDYLFSDPAFSGSIAAATELVKQRMPDGSMAEVYLLTPQDAAAFASFADLHERVSRKATPLTDDGVILTEKLAETLGVKAGDTVTLENTDGARAAFTVTGVCEHYVMNYAYLGPAAYAQGFGTAPAYNTVLSLLADDSAAARAAVAARLLDMEGVGAVNFTEDQKTTVLNMLNSINAVVVLIIVCAASLAFVVLYNLTNINIAERVKEIATIKVLGFYDREVSAYVNRESILLSLIGALLGLLGGIALHKFVIYTVEVDAVMFGRDIEPVSFLYAFALTMLFSIAVDLVMGRRLKKISMVESMKAPE